MSELMTTTTDGKNLIIASNENNEFFAKEDYKTEINHSIQMSKNSENIDTTVKFIFFAVLLYTVQRSTYYFNIPGSRKCII